MNAHDRRQRDTPRRRDDVVGEAFASLVQAAPVAIVGYTLDGRIISWNPAAEALFGYTRAEALGQSCSLLTPPERIEETKAARAQLERQGQPIINARTVRRHKSGAPIEVLLDAVLVPGTGRADPVLWTLVRPRAGAAGSARGRARHHDPELLLALAASGAGAFRFDFSTDEGKYDRAFAQLWELPDDQAVDARTMLARVHPDDLAHVRAALDRSTREGSDFEIEHRVVLPSGTERWLLSKGKTYTDPEGRRRYMTGVSVDITHRHRAEEALRQSEARFRGMAEAIPSIVWETDAEGRTLYKNRVWFEYTGQPVGRGSEEDWLQFYHPEDREVLRRARGAGARQNETSDVEARIRRHDGVYRWFRVRGAPLRNSDGTVTRWVGTCTDIDDQKRAGQALEEADRHKNEFLAMLAHELRNPLASIRNAAEIVRLGAAADERSRYALDVIGRQTERLGRLIADLLDMSNISRGRIALQREPCDLVTVVREALELNRGAIERKRQTLELRLPGEPMEMLGDTGRLVQLVSNLIDNAMKYTPEGGHIEVVLRHEGGRALLEVRDTGMGITPELLPRVFDLFVQGERVAGRANVGLGIGLALVKEIVTLHEGSITARSRGRARGAEFSVALPLTRGGAASPQVDAVGRVSDAHTRRVLIVDDNRDYADSLALLLEQFGHTTLVLYSSAEAAEKARDFAPDVALLDIGMPGMEGGELCRKLRRDPALAHVLYVAISGFGQDADRAQSRAAGFAHHLLKPVRLEELLAILGESVARPAER